MSCRVAIAAFVATAGFAGVNACASSDATDPSSLSGQKTETGQPGNQPGSEPPVLPNASRVFLWSPGAEMQVLPMPSYALEMVATDINDAGQVVGYVLLDMSGYTRAFVWSAADGYMEIGSLNGPEGPAIATSVNASGTVTGLSVGPEGILNGPMGIPLPHAFIWTAASGMKSLGEISDLASIGPVNAAGTIVGQGKNGTFFWNATTGFQNVPLPSGTTCSRTVDMNDKGQIVGYAGSGRDCFEFYSPFIWDIDGTHVLIEKCDDSLWCPTNVKALNNRGEVTGYRNGAAFRWSKEGGFITIPGNATGEDINDNGDVAGASWNDQVSKPFVWLASGAITTIELPAGSSSGYATAINKKRQVIGNFH
jgi:probable HAF family extracellular repeat protein